MVKEFFKKTLEELKNPVTTILEKSKTETLKKGCIKAAILSLVMAVVSILSKVISIFSRYSSKSSWYKNYSASELWSKRWDAIGDAELFSNFIRSCIIFALVIAIFALILFVIAKLVKKSKDYTVTLSMVNTTLSVYVVAIVLNLIISLIYAPLGILLLYAVIVYESLSLMSAFRISLEVDDTNKLILVSTAVLTAVVLIAAVIVYAIIGNSIATIGSSMKDLESLTDLIILSFNFGIFFLNSHIIYYIF